MRLSDEQNIKFMNDERRLEADAELREALKHIRGIETLSAETILKCMPPAIKKLGDAYENLIITEAAIEADLLAKENPGHEVTFKVQ